MAWKFEHVVLLCQWCASVEKRKNNCMWSFFVEKTKTIDIDFKDAPVKRKEMISFIEVRSFVRPLTRSRAHGKEIYFFEMNASISCSFNP